jgi:hypothetical protein
MELLARILLSLFVSHSRSSQDVLPPKGRSIGIVACYSSIMSSFPEQNFLRLYPPQKFPESFHGVYGMDGWLLRPLSWLPLR